MKRVSVHIGINYAGTSSELHGCLNDAVDWEVRARVTSDFAVTPLHESDATLENVVAVLNETVENLRVGDHFLLTFSGHGSWMPDSDGDEADGRDEVLCMYDFEDGGVLTDDELHRILSRRRHGTKVTIISDSCHSGTVNRAAPGVEAWTKPRTVPRFLPPSRFLDGADLARAVKVEKAPAKGVPRAGAVLMGGCADTEVSYDVVEESTGRPRGAFTMAALDALSFEPTTMRAWHEGIRRRLPSDRYPYNQHPTLVAGPWQARRRPLR